MTELQAAAQRLRELVRSQELGLVLLATVAGIAGGAAASLIGILVQLLHEFLFRLPHGQRLSGAAALPPSLVLALPAFGGLLVGIGAVLRARRRLRTPVDPIEANALYGGRMALGESGYVVAQNVVSSGFGASVGLEGGYVQLGSALASWLGERFRLRRSDQRMLVACGAAAAMAAAFQSPLTGAFYGFELILGTYSVGTLAPVMTAALAGSWTGRLFGLQGLDLPAHSHSVDLPQTALMLAIALLCALFAIALMRGVTLVDQVLRRVRLAPPWRTVAGGLAVGAMALYSPQIMGAGHAALALNQAAPLGIGALAILLLLKAAASALSLGAGFRGGLFFASLFLGTLLGTLLAKLAAIAGLPVLDPRAAAVLGMACVSVSVVGAPLAIGFLTLDLTGDAGFAAVVMAGVVIASLTVRVLFGFSFATWQFHLRGETIRSAHDVGWLRDLSVGRLMRRDLRTVRPDTTIAVFRRSFPLGSTKRVVVTDEAGRYLGIVQVPDAYEAADTTATIEPLLGLRDQVLEPQLSIKQAMTAFDAAESDELAVVQSRGDRVVVGLLTEAHALRRYTEEFERRRREFLGER